MNPRSSAAIERAGLERIAARHGVTVDCLLGVPAKAFPEFLKYLRQWQARKFYREHPELKPKRSSKGPRIKQTDEERKASKQAAQAKWRAKGSARQSAAQSQAKWREKQTNSQRTLPTAGEILTERERLKSLLLLGVKRVG